MLRFMQHEPFQHQNVLTLKGIKMLLHISIKITWQQVFLKKDIGRKLARLQQKREQSDYDDFFIASKEEAQKQYNNAENIISAIIEYLRKNNSGTII